MSDNLYTEVQAALKAGQHLASATSSQVAVETHGRAVLVPEGMKLEDVSEYKDKPPRTRRTRNFEDPDSFIEYIKNHATDGTEVYGSLDATFGALIDGSALTPGWETHRAFFKATFSPEFERWRNAFDRGMDQVAFSEFLEEVAGDIVAPESARLLEVARDLSTVKQMRFRSRINLANGDADIRYTEETENGQQEGSMQVPSKITVRLPIYDRTEPSKFDVLLRYRVESGALSFKLACPNESRIVLGASRELLASLGERISAITDFYLAKP